jgi:hypothetical protein
MALSYFGGMDGKVVIRLSAPRLYSRKALQMGDLDISGSPHLTIGYFCGWQ